MGDWPGIKRQTGPTGAGAEYIANVSYSIDGELRPRVGMKRASGSGTGPVIAMVHQRVSPVDLLVFTCLPVTDVVRP